GPDRSRSHEVSRSPRSFERRRRPFTGTFGASEDAARHRTSGSVNQTLGQSGRPTTGVGSRGGVVGRPHVTPSNAGHAYDDGTRRTEILQTAASLIATSGLRTSLQEIADAAGILPGSLYHHFESKEAILVELLRRYHSDLDRIAEHALSRLDDASSRSAFERIVDLGSAIAQCAFTHG